jgi:hypothetical protein
MKEGVRKRKLISPYPYVTEFTAFLCSEANIVSLEMGEVSSIFRDYARSAKRKIDF